MAQCASLIAPYALSASGKLGVLPPPRGLARVASFICASRAGPTCVVGGLGRGWFARILMHAPSLSLQPEFGSSGGGDDVARIRQQPVGSNKRAPAPRLDHPKWGLPDFGHFTAQVG